MPSRLPIDAFLPDIVAQLNEPGRLVLVAEPGAGKTTRVPASLLDVPWVCGEIWVLQPRRLAARMAAARVAEERGQALGREVGYQVRYERRVSKDTRLRFVTEGILLRRLAADPELSGIGAVVLDEFHERHLDTDLNLALLCALTKRHRTERREQRLRILVMSATLDPEPVAAFLACSSLRVPGRTFPVEVEHARRVDDTPLESKVRNAFRSLLERDVGGHVLVFLPGAREIARAERACASVARHHDVEIATLHGDLSPKEQDRAVRTTGRRKLILSTNVAETSVTIDGVVAVIDSGLVRVMEHSPWTGFPSLVTRPTSQASATQRAGRAGRTQPGLCLRLYTQHEHAERPAQNVAEIARGELSGALLLLYALGHRPSEFPFFESPPKAAAEAARSVLEHLGATDQETITSLGERMAQLPLHPRLGRLVLEAKARSVGPRGCAVAALLSERESRGRSTRSRRADRESGTGHVGTESSDLVAQLKAFEWIEAERFDRVMMGERGLPGARSVARLRDQIARSLAIDTEPESSLEEEEDAILCAILSAFPDRVARRRQPPGNETVRKRRLPDDEFVMVGGTARLAPESVVRDAEFVVAVDVRERRGERVIDVASAIEPEWLLELFGERVQEHAAFAFDDQSERVIVRHRLEYDGLMIDESAPQAPEIGDAQAEELLFASVIDRGLNAIWDLEAVERYRKRVVFAARHGLSVTAVDEMNVHSCVRNLCAGRNSFAELRAVSLLDAIQEAAAGTQDPTLARRLERFAPETVSLPGRSRVRVEYEWERPPWIASRLQDFFTATSGPTIAEGNAPLVLHLLAPNRRAVQVTTDLEGFWQRHYPRIRKELRRRYPRHAWPEDPIRGE